MRESVFERKFLDTLYTEFPGCFILKNDASLIQGIPDRLFLHNSFWAMLEFKKSLTARMQPNQELYIEKFGEMSFSAFVCPENAEDVLYGLHQAYQAHRDALFSQPK